MARYVRISVLGEAVWGQLTDDGVRALEHGPFADEPPWERRGAPIPWEEAKLLPPTVPTKIVCVGRNYRAHAAELGNEVPAEPMLFLKPPSCLVAHGEAIEHPTGHSELVHHEGELAIVFGRRAKRVSADEALDYVLGYTLMNDVTARDVQRREGKFTRAKGFDTFGPLGPWIDTDFAPADQRLTVHVNGALRQDGELSDMLWGVRALVSFVSHVMTLEPGDVLSTGTPPGVGPLAPGDQVVVRIAGLGELANPVTAATSERG